MRLHELQLGAFLAYGGVETVDFDALSEAGFFLIHGQTGAGKTSLLDAIAFAIYGELPGARKGVKSIRSDHAVAETPTFVSLDATVGAQRLRIRRRPEYTRPKKAGSGTTTEKAGVSIEQWTGSGWEPLTSSAQEAGVHIRNWIGFGADQFFRLALIPQGAFANFLNASSKARAEILEELFRDDLAVFGRVERHFRDALDAADQELRTADQMIAIERAKVAELLNAAGVRADDVLDTGWMADRIAQEEAAAATAAAEREVAKIAYDQAVTREVQAEEAIRASDRFREAEQALADAQRALGDFRQQHREHLAEDDASTALEPQLEAAERAARAQAEATARRNDAFTKLGELRQAVADATAALQHNREQIADVEAAVAGVAPQRAELSAVAAAGVQAAGQLEAVVEAAGHAKATLDLATRRDAAVVTLQQATATLASADRDLADATGVLAMAEATRTQGIAAELADGLQAGEPCPVCGSLEHPVTARPVESEGLDERIAAATAAVEHARTGQFAARAAYDRADAASDQLLEQLGEFAASTVAELARMHGAAEASRRQVADTVQAAGEATAALQRLEALYQEHQGRIRELQAEQAGLQASLTSATAAADALHADLGLSWQDTIALADVQPLLATAHLLSGLRVTARGLIDAVTAARAGLAALGEVTTGELPNLVELTALRVSHEATLGAATTLQSEAQRVVTRLREQRDGFERALAHRRDAELRRNELAAIARPINGEGPSRTKLTQYFLAARLRQVLDRANSRLQRMSDDRFEFVFDHDARGGGYRSLEIAVRDAWNGAQRPVSSLSGGESFTASLALALGLADIVQSEAGGTALDSLFIDEGFGTLSPDFLNRVIQDLDQLRASGRLVGIISHVDDLKQRIPVQLEVRKSSTGSTLRMEAAPSEA